MADGAGARAHLMASKLSRALPIAAWLLAAALAVWTLVRTAGLERGFPAVALIAFTPYVALGAAIAAPLAVLARCRRQALVIAACTGVLIVQVAPRAIPDSPPDPRPNGAELRVLGANLLYGRADLAALVELVRYHRIDAVALSELTPKASERISRSPLAELLPHAIVEPRGGPFGAGILSRHPLRRLPAPATGGDAQVLSGRIELPHGASAELHAVHPPPPRSPEEVEQLARYLAALPAADPADPPRLLVGDFNATLDHSEFRELLDSGYVDAADARGAGLVTTWSAGLPYLPVTIDHMLADERAEVLDFAVEDLPGSDHQAVFAALQLP